MRLATIDRQQDRLDPLAMSIEVCEPVQRGALTMRAAPAPFLLDRKEVAILADQAVARDHAAVEEMLRDPVSAVGAIEQVGARAVREDVHEKASFGRKPCAH